MFLTFFPVVIFLFFGTSLELCLNNIYNYMRAEKKKNTYILHAMSMNQLGQSTRPHVIRDDDIICC